MNDNDPQTSPHNTGEWVRKAAKFGEIHVSERGKTIAKIVPQLRHLKYRILHAESSARSFAE
jgi:antitoxin (DNA-binding transcriptional repressor) of toxin-antitoxin stability system